MTVDNGWETSARAYIEFQDAGDPNRTLLLDPVMLRMCGDVAGKRALDVGAGEGRFCRMLAERGAITIGLEPTRLLASTARDRQPGGNFVRALAERMPLHDGIFDVAVTYITLVDIIGYREAIAEMARVLRPGGRLVAANLSFVTASGPGLGWHRDDSGKRAFYRIDRYAEEWAARYEWRGISIENWHRPQSAYMQAYLEAGLILREFEEPLPQDESLRTDDEFEDWFRLPFFNVMRWEKPA